ncbi:hypothetical protein J2X97_000417 [Epilithonimonas hungarica]|jgi:hypothetical protein|uniref:DUF922 domain-containing protein n=1 Tax=Epilithonimonas hungarica TaxID=454006 RepID=UPI0027881EB5|nr:hypothetical protein [Epilithonimonas hungarica]MDP9954780.1 hypothetical protein [Epilithonimonas hungarica]
MLRPFLALTFLFIIGLAEAQDKIFWNEYRKLVWTDFESQTKPNTSQAAATTYCGISYLLNSSTKKFTNKQVKIESFFIPSKSWAHPEHKTDNVLMHEQSHFDIAELFARRFRKVISDKTLDVKSLQKYYERIYDDYKDYQKDYETVTNHGRIRDKQYEYTQKINSEIEKLSDFKI